MSYGETSLRDFQGGKSVANERQFLSGIVNFQSADKAGSSRGNQRSSDGQPEQSSTLTDPSQGEQPTQSNIRPSIAEIDRLIESYRSGNKTKLEVVSAISKIINDDNELSPQEKTQSFELFLAEIEASKGGGQREPKGKSRADPESSKDKLSRAIAAANFIQPVEVESSDGDESAESESGDEKSRKHQKLQPSDMPWHRQRGEHDTLRNPSCAKTAAIIRKLHSDLRSAKLYIRLTPEAPRGIPMSEWEHIFKGEPVNLDRILSSLHCVSIDSERKACIGETEISFSGVETKRKVETSSEWSTAWRSASQAIAFVFRHREQELFEYGDYIERLFAAKRPGSHGQVILFDRGVRNEVGGGQTILLTDYHYFSSLHAATLQDDGIEYHRGKKSGKGNRPDGSKTEICRKYNSQAGCRFSDSACRYRHACTAYGQTGHGKSTCVGGKGQ